jgi:outer membrane receptor protein involved in Fe transport
MRGIKFVGMLAVCASHSTIAHAQQAATAADAAETKDEAIVVTGTRIIRDGSQAPTPVTAVSTEVLNQSAPGNIPDALNKLPQFTGSTSQTAGGTFNAGSAPLGNYLNLRGLGRERNLILLNGLRVPPTVNSNAVDVNVLPQALISRVDVVTGGVSAVYGSDAVSGAVNFVLDTKFNGLKLSGQSGISNYGDSFSYRYGAAFGTKIGDRVHILASYEHYDNKGIPSLFDRSWAPNGLTVVGQGTAAQPNFLVANSRRCTATDGGLITAGALVPAAALTGTCQNGAALLGGVQFRPDGTLAPYNPGGLVQGTGSNGTFNITSGTAINGDGAVYGEPRNGGTSIAGTLNTHQAFGRVDIDLTDNIQFYAQGIYAISKTSFTSAPNNNVIGNGARTITIFSDNAYLRPELKAVLDGAGQSSFVMGRIFNDVPLVNNLTQTEFYNAQAGLTGALGGWKWDVNYVYGRADQKIAFNEWNTRKFYAAVDAVRAPNGQIVCRVTLTNPTLLPGCVPMNLMGDGNISAAAFAYARDDSKVRYVNTMNYVNANVHGDLFRLPAGPVQLAVGAEYRTQKLIQTSNSNPTFFNDPVTGVLNPAARSAFYQGIQGVPAGALLFNSINFGLASGTQTIKEGYGELAVPLLKDKTAFRDLSLDLAGRVTNYKTSGTVTTWKVGLNWIPLDGLRVRANRSRDIAAPNLNLLFAGASVVTSLVNDPTNNTSPSTVMLVTSGNSALRPEKADTTTIGIVAQPIRGLTLTVDAYRVAIKDAIGALSVTQTLLDCQASGGKAQSCGLITRDSNGILTRVGIASLNLASIKTQGVDFEASYRFPLKGGMVTLRAFANYLDKYETQGNASLPVIQRQGYTNLDGNGLPRWKGLLSQSWNNDDFSVSVSERLTGTYKFGNPTDVWVGGNPVLPNRAYIDTNLTYKLGSKKQFEAFLNVQNLFNLTPPPTPGLITNLAVQTDKATYDVVGRYFTVGVRAKF